MNNEVPKVVSKVGQQTTTATVTGSLNVVVPGDYPNGQSEPTIITSVNELYKQFGVSTAPSAEDDPALLQAAELLSVGPIWCVRAHKNKVFEGLTDSGERIFFDSNKNIIRHRLNITVGVDATAYNNIYLKAGNTIFYVGTLPEGVSADNEVLLSSEPVTYDEFFALLKTTEEVYSSENLFHVVKEGSGYTVYSKDPISASSNNMVRVSSTQTTLAKVNFGTQNYSQEPYILLNDSAYINSGVSASSYAYPGTPVELPFLKPSNSQPASSFAVYFFDSVFQSQNKKALAINNISIKKTFSDTTLEITSNIENFAYTNGVVSVPPTSELSAGKYIQLKKGTKIVVIENGFGSVGDENTKVITVPSTSVYCLFDALSSCLEDYNEWLGYDSTTNILTITDASKYELYSAEGKLVSFGWKLPNTASITDDIINVSKYGSVEENTSLISLSNVGIKIDETEYVIGDGYGTLSTDKVVVSKTAMSLSEFVAALTTALPSGYNATYEDNVISIFIATDEILGVSAEGGLSAIGKDTSFVDVEEGNTFAFVLKANARAKIAKFNWKFDNKTRLYSFTAEVNGSTYTRDIEFDDSTRVDGFGNGLFYEWFNRNYDLGEIVPIGSERTLEEFESVSFGNGVPVTKATAGDLQEALAKLKGYHFTKFEIMLDGGFINPAFINVMNGICSDIKAVLYSGTKVSSFVADLVEFRTNCPANSWNTMLLTPRLSNSGLGQFSVYQSPAVQYVKRIMNNALIGDEFEAVFGATKGTVSGTPEFNFDPETDQETLIQSSINTVYYSKEASITYFNDNYTLVSEKGPMQEECIVRMINAAAHVAEIWLEINAIARKNTQKLRDTVVREVTKTVVNRLQSNVTPYKDLEVVCDESNGNVDGSDELFVTGYATPYGSVHKVTLFTFAKSLSSSGE